MFSLIIQVGVHILSRFVHHVMLYRDHCRIVIDSNFAFEYLISWRNTLTTIAF